MDEHESRMIELSEDELWKVTGGIGRKCSSGLSTRMVVKNVERPESDETQKLPKWLAFFIRR